MTPQIPLDEHEAALVLSALYALRRELTTALDTDSTNVHASIAALMERVEAYLREL